MTHIPFCLAIICQLDWSNLKSSHGTWFKCPKNHVQNLHLTIWPFCSLYLSGFLTGGRCSGVSHPRLMHQATPPTSAAKRDASVRTGRWGKSSGRWGLGASPRAENSGGQWWKEKIRMVKDTWFIWFHQGSFMSHWDSSSMVTRINWSLEVFFIRFEWPIQSPYKY